MPRDTTVFYRSFYENIKQIPDKSDRWDMIQAFMDYLLDFKEPELDGYANAYFLSHKHSLDKILTKYTNGCKSIDPKPTPNLPLIDPKPTPNEGLTDPLSVLVYKCISESVPIGRKEGNISEDGFIFGGVAKSSYSQEKNKLPPAYLEINFSKVKGFDNSTLRTLHKHGIDPKIIQESINNFVESFPNGEKEVSYLMPCLLEGNVFRKRVQHEKKITQEKTITVNEMFDWFKKLTPEQKEHYHKILDERGYKGLDCFEDEDKRLGWGYIECLKGEA